MGSPRHIIIALGSNQGDRRAALDRALRLLGRAGVRVVARSRLYFTRPWPPGSAGPWFLNAAAAVETALSPTELLARMNAVEREMGRVRRVRWEPRPIDLDLIFYANETLARPELTVPHPTWAERDFVLAPLMDLEAVPPGWQVATARGRMLAALAATEPTITSSEEWR